ncbi:hypothetical protein [Oceanobacillus damuensis]|uniref:hypothetical protein n=1 Tax=Oceanobacillus damuensis TaxID=937928 RepID=UPI00082E5A82|nr:hypothetical protein [Oceanobacillus damuensis]
MERKTLNPRMRGRIGGVIVPNYIFATYDNTPAGSHRHSVNMKNIFSKIEATKINGINSIDSCSF